jgi:hypothetical protein
VEEALVVRRDDLRAKELDGISLHVEDVQSDWTVVAVMERMAVNLSLLARSGSLGGALVRFGAGLIDFTEHLSSSAAERRKQF